MLVEVELSFVEAVVAGGSGILEKFSSGHDFVLSLSIF
jgi:hypothetical protein